MFRLPLSLLSIFLIFSFGTANAATTKIKIATIVPQASSWGGKIEAAREKIKLRTDGRVEIKVYYGGVQGPPDKIKQKIRIGQLHGGDFTPSDFQDKLPNLNLYGLPFVFESVDEANYVRRYMDETLASGFEKEGFVTFGFAGDFSVIISNTPIRGLGDLKGRKIWLPEGDAISDRALKSLDLVPNSKPISDVLTGLKTGLFDVVAMPAAAAVALQLHTATSNYTDMPVTYAMQFLAIDTKVFNRLESQDQAIVREVLESVYHEIDLEAPTGAISAKKALSSNGVKMVTPNDGEFEKLRDLMTINNRKMAEEGLYSLELLEVMQGHIADFRSEHPAAKSPQDENEDKVAGSKGL